MTSKWDITTMDDAHDYVMSMLGSEFEKALQLCNSIIDKPSDFTGPQAAIASMKMALYRTKIGIAAQNWKILSAQTKDLHDRFVKDALMVTFQALEEVINTLKLVARHEHDITRH